MSHDRNKEKSPPLQSNLTAVMHALDNQIRREMQRSPSKTEMHGVQKWEPYQRRIELLTTFILEQVGGSEVSLDPVLVLSQSFSKALKILVDDLGHEGLGKVREAYCIAALAAIERDCQEGLKALSDREVIT